MSGGRERQTGDDVRSPVWQISSNVLQRLERQPSSDIHTSKYTYAALAITNHFSHCLHSTRCRVYVTICPPVRPIDQQQQRRAASFLLSSDECSRYRSTVTSTAYWLSVNSCRHLGCSCWESRSHSQQKQLLYTIMCVHSCTCCLQCFDTVGWAEERASGL